ncbi:uncharacterized protein LOC115095049 isoform X2 [Rhinatrema bivittatum]|uniref:uncharacterized protein LOC115095049 isoform X2 n=1 Tax=Rhinatrema bivittatum TaxID=194408 RepID=UPI00112D624D|nr:uncharacterized protein LOC115095049 isoform X2 [Rhinatrema bivittatum]
MTRRVLDGICNHVINTQNSEPVSRPQTSRDYGNGHTKKVAIGGGSYSQVGLHLPFMAINLFAIIGMVHTLYQPVEVTSRWGTIKWKNSTSSRTQDNFTCQAYDACVVWNITTTAKVVKAKTTQDKITFYNTSNTLTDTVCKFTSLPFPVYLPERGSVLIQVCILTIGYGPPIITLLTMQYVPLH